MSHFDKAERELISLEEQREQLAQKLEEARADHEAVTVDYRRAVGAVVLDGQPRSGDGGVSTVAKERQQKADEVEALEFALDTLQDRIEAQAQAAAVAKYLDIVEERNGYAERSTELFKEYGEAMLRFLELAHELEVVRSGWDMTKRKAEVYRTKTEYDLPSADWVAPVIWGRVKAFEPGWLGHRSSLENGVNEVRAWLKANK